MLDDDRLFRRSDRGFFAPADMTNAVRILIGGDGSPASSLPSWTLPAMQAAGLLRAVGRAGSVVLLTTA